ncbi:MAG TPA: hypothetical protein VF170_18230, partial [Planctomycetaceae bacterium]
LPTLTARRIVLVEKHSSDAGSWAFALREAGAVVTTASDAAALLATRTDVADVLLIAADRTEACDMRATRAAREAGFRGLILAVAGDWSPETAATWAVAGLADDCVPMPWDARDLTERLADYLARSRNADSEAAAPFTALR